MNEFRVFHQATLLLDGRVLVTGGGQDSRAEIYEPASQTWHLTQPMTQGRSAHTATLLLDGRVLVTGGEGDTVFATAEVFDPSTESFTPIASMSTPRRFHQATLMHDGRVLVTGGLTLTSPYVTSSAEIFQPTTNTWQPAAPMPTGLESHRAVLLLDGSVLVTGGEDPSRAASTTVLRYDPNTNSWQVLNPMLISREGHTATVLPDGTVLIAGGYFATPAISEIYNVSANGRGGQSTAKDSVAVGRFATATVLPGGDVLTVGGSFSGMGSSVNLWTAEQFHQGTNSWMGAGIMHTPRTSHASALLPDGRVLVTGGLFNFFFPFTELLNSAEIWSGIDPRPVSHIFPLWWFAMAPGQSSPNFLVEWAGTNAGAGIHDFTIYVSDNGGPFNPWLTKTTATQATYPGSPGHTYGFYSIARDQLGNVESPKTTFEEVTTVLSLSCATDITAEFKIIRGGFRFNNGTQRFVQTITLQHLTPNALVAPVAVVLDDLSSNATLFNNSGYTTCTTPRGSPWLNADGPIGSLSTVLEFTDPMKTAINYNIRILMNGTP